MVQLPVHQAPHLCLKFQVLFFLTPSFSKEHIFEILHFVFLTLCHLLKGGIVRRVDYLVDFSQVLEIDIFASDFRVRVVNFSIQFVPGRDLYLPVDVEARFPPIILLYISALLILNPSMLVSSKPKYLLLLESRIEHLLSFGAGVPTTGGVSPHHFRASTHHFVGRAPSPLHFLVDV